ncbi:MULTISPECIES: hypothetical protein [unclassified Streptomyces]|uniref:hypothetical protein n=1 Tax=unclassified Streptomyces TaxID=2593676 RepID=UPI00081B24A7|nr:hypothetical protein [Streptomyces sp. DvalAA-43]MYQ84898.1 hypothetical protein [Streptomyces sp. SID4936]SCD94898.1 hypothetical protein GA0115234_105536 [Streptomyces sp. DvalAA-43]
MRTGHILLALPLLALTATGCGILATDVVEVGDPAVVDVAPGREQSTLLYFVSSSSANRLMPVVRPNEVPWEGTPEGGSRLVRQDADKALVLLFEGPSKNEAATGLRTELPFVRAQVSIDLGPDGVLVRVNSPVTTLSEVARRQLICTAAQARTADRGEAVTVTGTDGVIGPAHCSV